MAARESLAVPAQARSRSGMTMTPPSATPTPSPSHRGQAHCGFCAQAWFGDVAYCPYCGRAPASAPVSKALSSREPVPEAAPVLAPARASASAPAPAPQVEAGVQASAAGTSREVRAHQGTGAGQGRARPKSPWTLAVLAAMVLACVGLALAWRAAVPGDAARLRATPRAPVVGVVGNAAPEANPAAAAKAPAPPSAAPTPRRSLCSAANERAGLCNPQ